MENIALKLKIVNVFSRNYWQIVKKQSFCRTGSVIDMRTIGSKKSETSEHLPASEFNKVVIIECNKSVADVNDLAKNAWDKLDL